MRGAGPCGKAGNAFAQALKKLKRYEEAAEVFVAVARVNYEKTLTKVGAVAGYTIRVESAWFQNFSPLKLSRLCCPCSPLTFKL